MRAHRAALVVLLAVLVPYAVLLVGLPMLALVSGLLVWQARKD